MVLKLVALVALLPLFAASTPIAPRTGKVINLTKRASFAKDGVVDVNALKAHLDFVHSKLQRGFDNFEKNTGAPHSRAHKLQRRATGTVPLTDDFDGSLWQGAITVGTPPVTFTVDFDTGSSDLFLPGSDCNGANCRGHTEFDTGASDTAVDQDSTFSLGFGDGSTVQGDQFTDTVTVGGLTATDQHVGAATQYSTGFALANFPPDGLLGMGFPQISVFGASPVFQTLVAEGQTTEPVFGFTLETSGSELFLGGTDTSKFTGDLTFTPVTEVGFWEIESGGVAVGGTQVVGPQDSIVDTGTTLVLGDTNSVRAVYAAIPGSKDASRTIGQGFFTAPCARFPDDVGLILGGQTFTMSPATFNLGRVSLLSPDCVGGLVADDVGFWVIGDVFLQNVYTSFDVGNEQVGFAPLA